MSEPIKIIVVAQTEEAAAKLQKFAEQEGSGLSAGLKAASKHSGELGESFSRNRVAMMELGHMARAMGEELAMGMSPIRILSLEGPRLLQTLSFMGIGLSALVPYLIAAGAAVGVLAAEWYAVMGNVEDSNKAAEKFTATLDKLPDLLKRIHQFSKAGLISPEMANRMTDEATLRKPLYIRKDGSVTDQPTEKVEEFYRTGDPFKDQTKHAVDVANRLAGSQDLDKIQKYQSNQLNQFSEKQAEAIIKGKDLEKSAHEERLSDIEKEKAAVVDKFTKQREEISETAKLAGAPLTAGDIRNPQVDAEAAKAVADLNAAQAQALAKIDADAQKKMAAAQAESEAKIRTQEAERTQVSLQAVEDKITQMQAQEGVKRGQFAALEYSMRINAAQRAYFAGDLGEQEYTHLVTEAQSKRLEGEKAYHQELQQTLLLKQELARTEAELSLHAVQSNPFLSGSAKASASVGPIQKLMSANEQTISQYRNVAATTQDDSARIQALTKINELSSRQIDLQRQLDAAKGEDSFTYQLGLAVTHLQDMNNLAKEVAQSFETVFNGAISSVSHGITGLIMGTMTWRQFLQQIPREILTEIVSAMVEMGVRWVATHVLMAAVSSLFHATDVANTGAAEAEKTAVVTGGAVRRITASAGEAGAGAASSQASIPYVGPILALAAMAAVFTAVMALAKGFRQGGYTGSGGVDEFAGIVHGGEYVFSAPAVQRLGVDNLAAMHQAGKTGGTGSAPSGAGSTKVVNVFDRDMLQRELQKPDYSHIIVNHVINNKTRIGIQT